MPPKNDAILCAMKAEIKIEGFEPLIIDSKTEIERFVEATHEKGETVRSIKIIKYFVFDRDNGCYIETERNPRKFMGRHQRLLKVTISRSGLVKTVLDPELT